MNATTDSTQCFGLNFSPIQAMSATLLLPMILFLVIGFWSPSQLAAAHLVVDSTSDVLDGSDGACTLREAITNANDDGATYVDCAAGSGADVIELPAGTYTLAIGGQGEDSNATGDFDILDGDLLVIDGDGASSTILDGDDLDRLFDVHDGARVLIRDLTISGGNIEDDGGGARICAGGCFLRLESTRLTGNRADQGGAIGSPTATEDSILEIDRSLIDGNTGLLSGGGILLRGGTLSMSQSTVSGNTGNGVGGLFLSGGVAEVHFTTISDNSASQGAGGLQNAGAGTLTLGSSIVSGNFSAGLPKDCLFASGTTTQSAGSNVVGDSGNNRGCNLGSGDMILGGAVSTLISGLSNNGGETATHALIGLGPGIDTTSVGDNGCRADGLDQRGQRRLRGFECDSGAFESGGSAVSIAADLSLTLSNGQSTVLPGEQITYELDVTNNGPAALLGITVSSIFPPQLDTCSWTCLASGAGSCSAGPVAGDLLDTIELPSGAVASYSATCTVSSSASGSISTSAVVSGGDDSDLSDNVAVDTDSVTPLADLSITKTDGVTTAVAGASVTYTITASNAGPEAVIDALVVDEFASIVGCAWTCSGTSGGVCAASGSGDIFESVDLPVDGEVVFVAVCSIDSDSGGSLVNTASISAPSGTVDPNIKNNSATDIDTLTQMADFSVSLDDGVTSAVPGETVTYTLVAANAGPSASTATVSDTFPASLTCSWTSVAAGGASDHQTSGSGDISDTFVAPPGGSVTYTIDCAISPQATGTLVNGATVGTTVTDPNASNNAASDSDVLTPETDLTISNTNGVTELVPGESTTYQLVVGNLGPSDAVGASISDIFSSNLDCTWTCTAGAGGACDSPSGSGDIELTAGLGVDAEVFVDIDCDVDSGATGMLSNTATVSPSAGATDPVSANNSATDVDTLTPLADLAVTKDNGVPISFPGEIVSYRIEVVNAGPSDALDTEVEDLFPSELVDCTWLCAGADGGVCTPGPVNGDLSDSADLPTGSRVTYTALCGIDPALEPCDYLTNTATVTAPSGVADGNLGNNSDEDVDAGPLVGIFYDGFESGDTSQW